MNASALLNDLTRSGIHLEPRGDRLHVEDPGAAVTPEIRQRLIENKAELMALLKPDLPAGAAAAYKRLKQQLAEHPTTRFACETLPDKGDNYVLLAVGVKGAGFAVLRIRKERFDGFELLKMVHRWNHGSKSA